MTTLLLSARQSPDSQALWRAAIARGWDVERSRGPTIPEHLPPGPYVIYHEALFAPVVAQQLGLKLIEPPRAMAGATAGQICPAVDRVQNTGPSADDYGTALHQTAQ